MAQFTIQEQAAAPAALTNTWSPISVRVEYTDQFGGPYRADYEFHPNEGGGDIIIKNPNTEFGANYKIWVTVEGYGETPGIEGDIDYIISKERFNIRGGSINPENPDDMLLLGFGVTVTNDFGPIPPGDMELYYKVTGRVFEPPTSGNPKESPFSYDPRAVAEHERPKIVLSFQDGTELAELGEVAADGRFAVYLLKTVIDAMPDNAWAHFVIRSPYVTNESTPVSRDQLQGNAQELRLHARLAGTISGTLMRGHLPAGTVDTATSYLAIKLITTEGEDGVTSYISLNQPRDDISFYFDGIPAGTYRVSFAHTGELWGAGTVFQYYNGKGADEAEAADLVTVRAFADISGIDTVSWAGDRDHGGAGDVTAPIVMDVSPVPTIRSTAAHSRSPLTSRSAGHPKVRYALWQPTKMWRI